MDKKEILFRRFNMINLPPDHTQIRIYLKSTSSGSKAHKLLFLNQVQRIGIDAVGDDHSQGSQLALEVIAQREQILKQGVPLLGNLCRKNS